MQKAQPLICEARVLTSSISDSSRSDDWIWVSTAVSALMLSGAAWRKFMRGFMVVLLYGLSGRCLVGAAGVEMVRLGEHQRGEQSDDLRDAEQVEGVAEAEDEGLLLDDLANRDVGVVSCIDAVNHAMAHEILGELVEASAGSLSNIDTDCIRTLEWYCSRLVSSV